MNRKWGRLVTLIIVGPAPINKEAFFEGGGDFHEAFRHCQHEGLRIRPKGKERLLYNPRIQDEVDIPWSGGEHAQM